MDKLYGKIIMTIINGMVKYFNELKGYGNIIDDEGNEYYVHYTNIAGEGYRTLHEGEIVEFEIADGKNGRRASNIIRAKKE
jgi:CspA family cold shock protein